MTNMAFLWTYVSVLCFLAWSAFEHGYTDDTGAIEVNSTVLDALYHQYCEYKTCKVRHNNGIVTVSFGEYQ